MVKLMALYSQPRDAARFEDVYFNQHTPLVKQMPGLRRIEVNRVTGAPRGEPAYYLVASLYFDDAETMHASMASEQSRAAARTLRDVGAEVTMLLADIEEL
jgi:uncharacterized protein (TIGR02118 family)